MSLTFSERAVAALAAAILLLALVAGLVIGLAASARHGPTIPAAVAFDVPPPRPVRPPPPEPRPRPAAVFHPAAAPAGPATTAPAAGPAPAPSVPLVIMVVPQVAGASGAATDDAGGGDGAAAGGGAGAAAGDGAGQAAEPAPAQPARQTRGYLSPRDVPDGLIAPGRSVSVRVRFRVGVDGRVQDCRLDGPSGVAAIDAVPCRLIVQRYRFRPARAAGGQPVAETITETHTWFEPDRPVRPGVSAVRPRPGP